MAKSTPNKATETVINKTHYWASVKDFFKSPDRLFEMEDRGQEIKETAVGIKADLRFEFLDDSLKGPYESLSTAIGKPLEVVGAVKYDANNSFSYFSVPTVGLGPDGRASVMIGSYSEPLYIPLENQQGSGYSFCGFRAEFVTILKEDTDDICLIKVKGVHGFNHFFPIKGISGLTSEQLEAAFDSNTFQTALNGFSSYFAKGTNICQHVIADGQFPASGIMFVLTNPVITPVKTKTGSEFMSASFTIAYCSHPEFDYCESSKNKERVSVQEILRVSFTDSGAGSAVFNLVVLNKPNKIYLHFVEPYTANGAVRANYTPKMSISTMLRGVTKKNQELLERAKGESLASGQDFGMIEASSTVIETTATAVPFS